MSLNLACPELQGEMLCGIRLMILKNTQICWSQAQIQLCIHVCDSVARSDFKIR